MRAFFDSSALAKRYIKERGSERVDEILSGASEVATSLIGPLEIISALCRLLRQSLISAAQYALAKKCLFKDIEDMFICNVTIPVVNRAIDLLEKHSLRSLDALHVACALEWQTDLFVSADRRQASIAAESGLRVYRV
jgi:predicted nucleic acid-binding protein